MTILIKEILLQSKVIVVVGCSSNPGKAAHEIPKFLQKVGYRIIPINPNTKEILGEKSYSKISDIKETVDIVNIFRPSKEVLDIVKEAIKIRPKTIWMQLGIENNKAKILAEENKIEVVMNKCIMIEREKLKND